jgi:cell division protein FtsB
MSSKYLLRKQVSTELKIRRYIVYTLLLLSIVYITGSLVFGETGILRYMELKDKQKLMSADISKIMEENFRLESSIASLKTDDFYLEKHAREEYGLAKPDEYIYLYR